MPDKIKILAIDDEEAILKLLKQYIEGRDGYEVFMLTDPSLVKTRIKEISPDLILLDVVMPTRRGDDIARELKKGRDTKDIPIIVMSGLGEMVYSDAENKWKWLPNRPIVRERGEVIDEKIPWKAAEAYGVEDYISKPFDLEELMEVIEANLRTRRGDM